MSIVIRKAEQTDLETIQGLLLGAGVSTRGVEGQLEGFLLVEADDDGQKSAVGTVGLEIIDGKYGVMRSLVIKKGANTAHLGAELIRLFVAYVESTEIQQLYLLTQSTATPLFIHIGFSTIHRDEVPEAVAQSPHFLAYKNKEAVCLVKTYTSTSYPHPHVDSVNK